MDRANPDRSLNTPDRLRDIDPAAQKRKHEFVIPTLHGSEVCDFRIRVVRCAKCHLESSICLEQPVKPVAVTKLDKRGRTQIVSRVPERNGWTHAKTEVVMVNLVSVVLSQSERRYQEAGS